MGDFFEWREQADKLCLMGLQKEKRTVNRDLLSETRQRPCAACGARGPSHAHHLTTRGAGGNDTEDNLMPLCFRHHAEFHTKGASYMVQIYRAVSMWLIDHRRFDVIERGKK